MRAFVTGATGQDGHYLMTLLHERGDEVHALYRGQDEARFEQFKRDYPFVAWHRGDVTDAGSVAAAIISAKPEAVFNLAALSYVGLSWQMPSLYMEVNYGGLVNVLEAVRQHAPEAHVIQASTSEMYGNTALGTLNEESSMAPASPYGVAKLAAHRLCGVYRDSYGMRVTSAISFNHESPRRPPIFVTRKITLAACRIAAGLQERLTLGNVTAQRDWGYAEDFMRAYILMAEAERADDYVVGTGESHSVAAFAERAFRIVGLERTWLYIDTSGEQRPNDVNHLRADASKLRHFLGWRPRVTFDELVQIMVDADRVRETVQA